MPCVVALVDKRRIMHTVYMWSTTLRRMRAKEDGMWRPAHTHIPSSSACLIRNVVRHVQYAHNASFYQQDISGCVDEAAVYTREKHSRIGANPASSEIYDPCEPPDHAWQVMNFARVGETHDTFIQIHDSTHGRCRIYMAVVNCICNWVKVITQQHDVNPRTFFKFW